MLDSKQRKYLSGLGQKLDPVFQIGKNGTEGAVLGELSDVLDARELIKVSVNRNCEYSAREIADVLASELAADTVSCVGSKIVLYRRSERKDIKHLEFPKK